MAGYPAGYHALIEKVAELVEVPGVPYDPHGPYLLLGILQGNVIQQVVRSLRHSIKIKMGGGVHLPEHLDCLLDILHFQKRNESAGQDFRIPKAPLIDQNCPPSHFLHRLGVALGGGLLGVPEYPGVVENNRGLLLHLKKMLGVQVDGILPAVLALDNLLNVVEGGLPVELHRQELG